MQELEGHQFLSAALEDISLVSDLNIHKVGSPRHIVCLMHDSIEFILYESLLVLDLDIYKNGQNTIGLDAAMRLAHDNNLDLPLIATIRRIQKLRGDAKHHAQTPHESAFLRISAEYRIITSRLIHERFGQTLRTGIKSLGLLPYHVALYDSYRKYRTHNWDKALQFALSALLHKHRAVLELPDDYLAGRCSNPHQLLEVFDKEVEDARYVPASDNALDELKMLPEKIRSSISNKKSMAITAEIAGKGYASVDGIIPGIFDVKKARFITPSLVQPDQFIYSGSAMFWSKKNFTDTKRKHEIAVEIKELLRSSKTLVKSFGPPHYDEDDDRCWRWWEFAVYDGTGWYTFRIDDTFDISLESGDIEGNESAKRESTSAIILSELKKAVKEVA